ncbi:hypothetical protein GCM10010277_75760 [Streptomyces longisporoflavus]|uniref:hypothetical protein n=1 Tax=Streptomyces longisporoflavus TaxID=28044 RepID=UPI00167EA086|nr:hypothetical protein [Streptomyces longisporoflavus]GGV67268.1 hypothetical protein GCM10010277_75760 [Streptomyces longisporoflavus]
MTSPIDHLLARARLVDSPRPAAGPRCPYNITAAPRDRRPAGRGPWDDRTAQATADLRTLCETVATRAALETLARGFLTATLPADPDVACVLGCLLQLGQAPDAARFWWQFAAGAGDHTAAYCLALQHRSQGEETAALLWLEQIPGASDPDERVRAEPGRLPAIKRPASLPTTLRILRRLSPDRRFRTRQPDIADVITYVASAIEFVDDDLELPLPVADFTARIRSLTTPGLTPATPPPPHTDPDPLPARHRGGTAIRSAQRRIDWDVKLIGAT